MAKSPSLKRVTLADAASVMNMSRTMVAYAVRVRRFGVPELVAAVERGEIPVSAAAKIVRLPPHEQREALASRGIPRPKATEGSVEHHRLLGEALEMLEALTFDHLKEAVDLISKVKRGEQYAPALEPCILVEPGSTDQ
jgi:predicted HTH domain antitoxin